MRSNFSFNWQEDRRASFYVEYVNLETIFYIIIDEWNTLSYSTAGHGRVFGIRYVQTLREPSTRTGFWTSWYIETYLWLLMTRLLGRRVWFNQAGKYVLLYQICIGVEIYLIIYFLASQNWKTISSRGIGGRECLPSSILSLWELTLNLVRARWCFLFLMYSDYSPKVISLVLGQSIRRHCPGASGTILKYASEYPMLIQ